MRWMPAAAGGAWVRTLGHAWRQQVELLLGAGAMMGSTVATAALGFLFWWVAARTMPAEAVGIASSAIATMGFLALAGDLGLGTLLIGQMPRHAERAPALVSAAFWVAALGSAVLGLGYALATGWLVPAQAQFVRTPLDALVFVLGVAVTGLVLVLDQTLLGVARGRWHLARNLAFALAKLLLIGMVAALGARGGFSVYATWLAGNLLSLLLLVVLARRARLPLTCTPDFRLLASLTRPILGHHALNVLSQAPGLLMPVLVTAVLSARTNAAFYIAWLLIGVAYLAPASLTTALFAVAARDTGALARRLRFSLAVSMGLSALTVLACATLGRWALGLFHPEYADLAAGTLTLLAAAMPAVSVKYHYIALKRIREEMTGALPLLAVGAVLELGVAAIGGRWHGLPGLGAGWLLVACAEALWMLPTLLRAAWPRGDSTENGPACPP